MASRPPRLRDSSEFSSCADVIVDVFHHLRADHAIKGGVAVGQMEGIALIHGPDGVQFSGSVPQASERGTKRGEVQIESDDTGPSLETSEAVSTFSASGIKDQMLIAYVKPIEVDG